MAASRSKAAAADQAPDAPIPTWDPPDVDKSPIPGASPFQLTKAVNLAQLEAELTTALNVDAVGAAIIGPNDPTLPLSDDNYSILWLSPSSSDPQTVYNAIAAHVPDPQWGVPTVVTQFNTVWAALLENPEMTLTTAQLKQLAVGLAFRVMSNNA